MSDNEWVSPSYVQGLKHLTRVNEELRNGKLTENTCQCKQNPYGVPCEKQITQEDLLCDNCRAGCQRVHSEKVEQMIHRKLTWQYQFWYGNAPKERVPVWTEEGTFSTNWEPQ